MNTHSPQQSPDELSAWDELAEQVEAFSPGFAKLMHSTTGPERSNVAHAAADRIYGLPGTKQLVSELRATAYRIRG